MFIVLALILLLTDELNNVALPNPLIVEELMSPLTIILAFIVWSPTNVLLPVIANEPVYILPPPPGIVTDAVPDVIVAVTPAPLKLNDVAVPNIVPSSCTCNAPPAELILLLKEELSALY